MSHLAMLIGLIFFLHAIRSAAKRESRRRAAVRRVTDY